MSATFNSDMESTPIVNIPDHQRGLSPLLALPGELRNQLYSSIFPDLSSDLNISARNNRIGFTLTSSTTGPDTFGNRLRESNLKCRIKSPTSSPPPTSKAQWHTLLLICRALHSEIHPLIFSTSPRVVFSNLLALQRFCSHIPVAYRAMIKSIHLHISFKLSDDIADIRAVKAKNERFRDWLPGLKHISVMEHYPLSRLAASEERRWVMAWLEGGKGDGVQVKEDRLGVFSVGWVD